MYCVCAQSIVSQDAFKWWIAKVYSKDDARQVAVVQYYTNTREWGPFKPPHGHVSHYDMDYCDILAVVKLTQSGTVRVGEGQRALKAIVNRL